MRKHRACLAAPGTALALALAACGGSSHSAGAHQRRVPAQVFTYGTYTQVMSDGWDPATEYSSGIIAMSNMYETLTRYNPVTHKVGPLPATSWSSSRDGRTWTFHLRHGVFFHTGRLMTAQLAKAAVLRTVKVGGGASYVWNAVKSIRTPDPYTLVFALKYPSPLALVASADYSAYIYDTKPPAGSGSSLTAWLSAAHYAGTGPYRWRASTAASSSRSPSRPTQRIGAAGPALTTSGSCSASCRKTPPRCNCSAPGRSVSSSR